LNNLVCNTPTTPMLHVATPTDAEKAIRRIDYISRFGVYLLKGGMDETTLQKHLKHYACGRWPVTYTGDEKTLQEDVHMAVDKAQLEWFEPSVQSFANLVQEWVSHQDGTFSLQKGYSELRLTTLAEKKHFRTVIARELKKGSIKKEGSNSGVYAPVKGDIVEEDWKNSDESKAPLWLPFDLGSIAVVPYGSICLFSGSPNSGKTATLMNTAYENMKEFNVHYFSSEIGPGAFKRRAAKFPYTNTDDWNLKFYQRSGDFEDCIISGKGNLNIIDYLEVHNDFWKVGDFLNKIHGALNEAICIIALQKNPGSDTGRGGFHTLEKPQVAISIDHGTAKCVKLKEWAEGYENPNHKIYDFKLIDGCQFKKVMGWHYPKES